MSAVRAIPPALPNRPPLSPVSPTFVQMPQPALSPRSPTYVQIPPSLPQRASTVTTTSSSSSSSSSRSSQSSTPSQASPPPVSHANSYPAVAGRTFDYSDYADFPDLRAQPFAAPQPVRSASTSLPSHSHSHRQSHSSHSHRPQHRAHGMSSEDRALALMLQREEESRVSEEAIRAGLTQQFAKASGHTIEQVDLSNLTLEEAQQAIEIQLKIRADKKKKGILGGLKARFTLNSASKRKNKPNTSPTGSNSSGSHLSVSGGSGGESGRLSPSGSPLPANMDVDTMSYEELLALSEAIGDVKSKGMSENEIERLPTAVWERKRAEGEPEDEPEPVQEANSAEAAVGAGDVSDAGKWKAKKKRGFFARIRGSSKAPLPPTLSSVILLPHPAAVTDDGKSEKVVVGGSVESQWRDTCSVCLESFRNGELIKYLPCFHHFHAEELDNWLLVNASCPICKQKPVVH